MCGRWDGHHILYISKTVLTEIPAAALKPVDVFSSLFPPCIPWSQYLRARLEYIDFITNAHAFLTFHNARAVALNCAQPLALHVTAFRLKSIIIYNMYIKTVFIKDSLREALL